MLTKIKGYYKSLNDVQKKFYILHTVVSCIFIIVMIISMVIIACLDMQSSKYNDNYAKLMLFFNGANFFFIVSQAIFFKIVHRSKLWVIFLLLSAMWGFVFFLEMTNLMR
jgi:hypothetical protein